MKSPITIYGHFHKQKVSLWRRFTRRFFPKFHFREILKSGSYINKNEEFFKQFVKGQRNYVKPNSKKISHRRTRK